MGDRVHVDPASLRVTGRRMQAEADAVTQALHQLRSTLHGLGDVCGDDGPGHTFGAAYRPQAQQLETLIDVLAQGLHAVSSRLQEMAGNYEGAEQANTVRMG